MVMTQLGDESYAASLADQNCWQVRTSKRLTYTLRHNHDLSLGRYKDALFENIDRELQAFRWAPHKILRFLLLGNTKTRFAVHVQLRRLHYDDIPSIDWTSGGWRTSSASPGRTWVRSTGNPSPAWIAWSRASLSGRILSQWRDGLRLRTRPTSTRSASPNRCCAETGMYTCFRIPPATLTLLS